MLLASIASPALHHHLLQELSTVDKACRDVDSTSPTDCYDVDGTSLSAQSKRDVGIMLEVIITYTNKYATTRLFRLPMPLDPVMLLLVTSDIFRVAAWATLASSPKI